jgi:hypothetical protein
MQVADAAQATLGIDIGGVVVTEHPLGVEKWIDEKTRQPTGWLGNSMVLVDAVEHLVRGCRAEAIAVVGRFPDDAEEELVDYRQGQVRDRRPLSSFISSCVTAIATSLLLNGRCGENSQPTSSLL